MSASDTLMSEPAFELPPELAIDTDSARRIIVGFVRAQLEQAGHRQDHDAH